MTIIFTDGFDYYTSMLQKWTSFDFPAISAGNGRASTAALSTGNTGGIFKQLEPATEHATLTMGAAIRRVSGGFHWYLRSDSRTTTHLRLTCSNVGQLTLYRGDGTTQLWQSGIVIPDSTFVYLELQATLSDSVGTYEIRLNGATLTSATNQDTKNGGTKTVFDSFGIVANGATVYFDDLYVTNGDGSVNTGFLGDIRVETLFVSGNGTTSQLMGSDGNSIDNYLLVDETPPNTTDYTGSAVDEQYDTYALNNLSIASGAVYGITVWAYCAKSDAGAKGGAIVLRSGNTDYEKSNQALGTGYAYIKEVIEVDPATSAAWTVAGINSLEIGFKVKAS